jgi:hypothetical protein
VTGLFWVLIGATAFCLAVEVLHVYFFHRKDLFVDRGD